MPANGWGKLMATRMKAGSDDFDPMDWPFFWMTQAVGRYLQKLERGLKKTGLDVSRWRVLMCVSTGTISVGEIAEMAIVKLPTMMKIVQRMESDGLVTCESRPSDGRFTDVTLTSEGLEARKTAWQIANRIYEVSFRDIPTTDRNALNRLLKRVFEGLND
jgi:DNA-binding MarR family transcriptional regulator